MRKPLTILLLASALMATALTAAPGLTPLQAEFVQSFHVTLQDCGDDDSAASATQGKPPVGPSLPIRNLLPPPSPQVLRLNAEAWLATAATTLLSLMLLIYGSTRKFLAFYNVPRRKLRRQARRELSHLVRQDLSPELALPHLRDFFALPPSATLEQVAQAAHQQNLTDLANACHEAEQKRFNTSDTDCQKLRKAIAKLVSCILVLLLTSAGMAAYSDWRHAELLAAQGDTQKALELFLALHDAGPQSPELSQNIATLIAVTGNTQDLPPPQTWKLHAECLRQAQNTPVAPEVILPVLPPLVSLLLWFLLGRHLKPALGTALLTALALGTFLTMLEPRLTLRTQAVAAPQTALHASPEDTGTPTAILETPQCVTCSQTTHTLNGRILVTTQHAQGWCDKRQLLQFR